VISQQPYKVPERLKEGLQTELKELLESGIIKESDSSWAAPMVPVMKPNSAIRLCVDYRRLNDATSLQRICFSMYLFIQSLGNNTFIKSIKFLRHVLCKNRELSVGKTTLRLSNRQWGKVCVPEQRIEAMRNFIRPVTKKDPRAFLGTVGYYRCFTEGFVDMSSALSRAMSTKAPGMIQWSEMLEAFDQLKISLCNYCVLQCYKC